MIRRVSRRLVFDSFWGLDMTLGDSLETLFWLFDKSNQRVVFPLFLSPFSDFLLAFSLLSGRPPKSLFRLKFSGFWALWALLPLAIPGDFFETFRRFGFGLKSSIGTQEMTPDCQDDPLHRLLRLTHGQWHLASFQDGFSSMNCSYLPRHWTVAHVTCNFLVTTHCSASQWKIMEIPHVACPPPNHIIRANLTLFLPYRRTCSSGVPSLRFTKHMAAKDLLFKTCVAWEKTPETSFSEVEGWGGLLRKANQSWWSEYC